MSTDRFIRPIVTGALLGAFALPHAAFSQDAAPPAAPSAAKRAAELGIAAQPNQVRGDEITPQSQAATDKGLAWLAAQQAADGSFGRGGGGYGATTAITALSGLAFMSAGNLPGRGKYGDNVRKAVEYICKSSQESGLLCSEAAHGAMYSHGFATLFLGEVYGMTGDEQVKEKLLKAVRLIEKCQNQEGGWRYNPVPYDADISVTIAQVMALRAARDGGVKVEKEVIDKAIAYVRRCQNADGGFSYMANGGGGPSGFERSAAGVAALYYAGVFEGDDIKRGLEYCKQYIPGKGVAGRGLSHYYYGQYYACQAMFLAGGTYWADWYPAIREELVAKQDRSGGWTSAEIAPEYGTAVALIVLQMPNRYLPVFNGKGPGA